ncbi:MAG: type II toxin-antitoxin system VapC family toxin [Opitutaceae bacterium]|nr:type II toxin-antitoxin system VapC family toxin [Opitutaceae bacterium]
MSFLIDTNVVSEPTRARPDARVMTWFAAQPDDMLFISALTLGELRRGILQLAEGKKRRELLRWLENEIEPGFSGRILGVDAEVARHWAEIQDRASRAGKSLPAMDSLFAATARAHDLTLVTRNTADFAAAGIPLIDPWQEP